MSRDYIGSNKSEITNRREERSVNKVGLALTNRRRKGL
jgi:hypothetical protein